MGFKKFCGIEGVAKICYAPNVSKADKNLVEGVINDDVNFDDVSGDPSYNPASSAALIACYHGTNRVVNFFKLHNGEIVFQFIDSDNDDFNSIFKIIDPRRARISLAVITAELKKYFGKPPQDACDVALMVDDLMSNAGFQVIDPQN